MPDHPTPSQPADPIPQILMCPPDFYGIEYEINPWMDRQRQVDPARAVAEWEGLVSILKDLGVDVLLLSPVEGLPDMVFTANAAMIYRQRARLSHFRYPQRQGEEAYHAARLEELGYDIQRVSDEMYFEGAGDALFAGDTLVAGYRIRSDAQGHQEIGASIGTRVIPLELVDPYYYHLDTCFCPLEDGLAIFFPEAFDVYGRTALNEIVERLIAVEVNEAKRFACNAVVVGRTVVTNTGCPQLQLALKDRGYRIVETPLDEFVKAGGSAKCLTLRLDGEEAAGWRRD